MERQTPWEKSTIEKLRKKAYAQISVYRKKEKKERAFEPWAEKRLKRGLLRNKNIPVDSDFIYTVFPFVSPLKDRLERNAANFIQAVNAIFGISVGNIGIYVFRALEYDIERYGIEPLGKFYIDTLCEILEGTTWYIRKNNALIFAEIKKVFEESDFIQKYQQEN